MGEGTAKFGREAVAKGVCCSRVDVYPPVPPPIVVKTRTINANVQYIHIRRQAQRMLLCAQYVYMFVRAAGGPVARCVRAAHTAATDTTVCATDTEHCDLCSDFCVLSALCLCCGHSAHCCSGSQPPPASCE